MSSIGSVPLVESMNDEKAINPNGRANHLQNDVESSLCCPSLLSCLISCICPQTWLCSCQSLRVREEKVLLYWGKHAATLREPGCYCLNPAGLQTYSVITAVKSIELDSTKVSDLNGNPILISGIVNYDIVDSKRALLDTQNVAEFVRTQALAVMKRVASHFPYEAKATLGSENSPHEDCLKGENVRVKTMLMQHLQEKVASAGARIISFDLSDLSYAPEIAQAMLVRQQAGAMLEARKLIVSGAVEIAHDVLRNLEKKGILLDMAEQARLTNNLLITIVSEKAVNTQISLSEMQPHQLHHK